MTASEYQSQMVPFAMELVNRVSLRLEHHNSLTLFEIEDIKQELLTYVLESASQFDPAKGSIEAFVTQMMRTAAARLIRGSNRRRGTAGTAEQRGQSISVMIGTLSSSR